MNMMCDSLCIGVQFVRPEALSKIRSIHLVAMRLRGRERYYLNISVNTVLWESLLLNDSEPLCRRII